MSLSGKGLEYINKLFKEDNLELLRRLPDECIDLIYCDILYNTGRKFNDYDDNLGTPQEAIEWYKPRLSEMKRALRKTGSIYLQCDFRLVHYLKVEMDNIFGLNNFRNEIIWCYRSQGFNKKQWSQKHDDILFYTKSNKWTFNADDVRENEIAESTMKRWHKEIEKYNAIPTKKNGKVYWNSPYSLPRDWWEINALPQAHSECVGYDTQKPKKLLERIIKASSNEGELVADFFCGSGTTCVVAKELGRNYLGCDIGGKAISITNQRLNGEL